MVKASQMATEALRTNQLVYQVDFDGQNGISNTMQTATFDALPNRLAPLPRLDFLDPKYYSIGTPETNQKPVVIAKAEEAYLYDLLRNIATRPVVEVDDSNETRNGGNRQDYPLTAVAVKFDAEEEFQEDYILDRQQELINVYTISGTRVTEQDITNALNSDQLLYLIYRLRQEVFISEGRRVTDLGIKYPISQIEQDNNPNIDAGYTTSQIPDFIANADVLDNFQVDGSGNIIIDVDMNKIIVQNKTSPVIVPFF